MLCLRPIALLTTLLSFCVFFTPHNAIARKTNEPFYQEPFDLAAGGASLTRASRAGRIFSNPALMSYGGGFSLWIGSTTSIFVNDGICELAGSSCPVSADDGSAESESSDILQLAFKKPFRLGLSQSFAMIFNHIGFSVFSRNEIDLNAKKVGPSGTPSVAFSMESYSGLQVAAATRSPMRWLSLGGAVRGIIASEPELELGLEVLDQLQGEGSQEFFQQQMQERFTPVLGYGFDIGTLFFAQGRHVDYSLAVKVDDVGNTKLTPQSGLFGATAESSPEEQEPVENIKEFKQVVSSGLGFTLHTGMDQLHLSIDYRDLLDAYNDPLFKKIYIGAKATLRQYLGLAMGLHHGYSSAGVELNFLLVQISLITYARELSDKPGLDPRRYYMLSFSMGG
ncbi:MAG: hypothetical protein R3B45_14950 [Bdellovibrionota bacterium]